MTRFAGMMPAEFSAHEETLMCWPVNEDLYGDQLSDAQHAHADVAKVIAAYEPVRMFAPIAEVQRAESLCGSRVSVHAVELDDSWCRDIGPVYVFDDRDQRTAVDWAFNGWGERFSSYDKDNAFAQAVAQLRGDPLVSCDMVFEGGSLNVDGRGTGITTMQCLLHPNRNPSLSKVDIEHRLAETLGVSHVVWLPFGLYLDGDTDGHVDNVAAFTPVGTVLLQGCSVGLEEDIMRASINQKIAEGSQDASGKDLSVQVIPVLPYVETVRGQKCSPYVNYYVANGCVVVPTTGHEADHDMLQIIEAMYPNRDVVGVPVGKILAAGGGGIHCITQQVPARL